MKRKSIPYFILIISVVIILVLVLADFNSIKKMYIITFHKSGIVANYNTDGKLDGEVDTYLNGAILEKRNFKNGLHDGWQFSYYPNGIVERKSFYNKNKIDSTEFSYYKDGRVKSKEYFKDGKRDGSRIIYYQNGQIEQKSFRQNSKVEGMEYIYYENGNLKCKRNWVNNKPFGDYYYYYPNKKIEIYHTYDILSDKFYLCRYDQAGNVLRSDGYVFSSRIYTRDNDSVEVLKVRTPYKSIRDLYVTVANPPQSTTEIQIKINNKLCKDLSFPDRNTVMIKNAFDHRGSYHIAIEAVFDGKSGFTDHTTGKWTVIKE